MVSILVQSREAASRLDSAKLQSAPRVVPSACDATPQGHRLPGMRVALANGTGEPSRRILTEAPLSIGYLLYLSSVALIAAGIVAVFFGTGFSLLVPTGGGTMSGSVNRPGPQVMPLPSPVGNAEQQTFLGQASARENEHPAQSSIPLPARADMPAMDRKDDAPHLDQILVSKAPTAPANAPLPVPNPPAETALVTPTPGLSNSEVAELLDHGDALLRNGDVASARLFYERAAGAGDGRAALRLGATFDPEFLGRLGLGKLQANPAEARSWYSRALDLGVVDVKRRLNSVQTSRGNSFQ